MKTNRTFIRLTLLILALCLCTPVFSQNISGHWQGRFRTDQRIDGSSRTFYMSMVLRQEGRNVEGRFSNADLDFPNRPNVVYEISGIIGKKQKIPTQLMRNKVLYNSVSDQVADYFLSLDNITYFKNDTAEVLYGDWTANGLRPLRPDGFAGSFWVSRPLVKQESEISVPNNVNAGNAADDSVITDSTKGSIATQLTRRENYKLATIEVNTPKITLRIYDNGITDGDSISLFFNGRQLLAHQLVSEKAIELNLELDEKNPRNEIVLIAENLGTLPPNTALIIIEAGNKRYELFSSVDLRRNGVVVVVRQ